VRKCVYTCTHTNIHCMYSYLQTHIYIQTHTHTPPSRETASVQEMPRCFNPRHQHPCETTTPRAACECVFALRTGEETSCVCEGSWSTHTHTANARGCVSDCAVGLIVACIMLVRHTHTCVCEQVDTQRNTIDCIQTLCRRESSGYGYACVLFITS
jgi:hypothetical protein